jgi:NADH-quinone oxidoreductase subunit J
MVECLPVTLEIQVQIPLSPLKMLSLFFYSICLAGLIFAILVIVSINPVHSVLFLVLSFFNFSIILFLLGLEFIPILLIIIYVGAIAILFLFVVMMLDIKLSHKNKDIVKFLPFLYFCSFCIFILEIVTTKFMYLNDFTLIYGTWFNSIDSNTNIDILGKVLFIDYYLYVLLSGVILLLALIGSVVLTLKFNISTNYQTISKQISRDLNLAVFFIK